MKSLYKNIIDNLIGHVQTIYNLRPLAANIAKSIEDRSNDACTRMMVVEYKLAEVLLTNDQLLTTQETSNKLKSLKDKMSDLVFDIFGIFPHERQLIRDTVDFVIDFFIGKWKHRKPKKLFL
jgi:hypothetical protein